jgi:hypothetical protein
MKRRQGSTDGCRGIIIIIIIIIIIVETLSLETIPRENVPLVFASNDEYDNIGITELE